MAPLSLLLMALATTVSAAAIEVPSLSVPACPSLSTISYDHSVPNKTAFPLTQVQLCYNTSHIHMNFAAYGESSYYYNTSLGTNDEIYNYEVMEAFIYHGTNDPQQYLEFEVNPINVTYQAFVYNPSKVRATGAVFDHFYITDPITDGISAQTAIGKTDKVWRSEVAIPLGLFNVDDGTAKGTKWRMNFFRTITNATYYPNQDYGAWSVPDEVNFHMTPYFGDVCFV